MIDFEALFAALPSPYMVLDPELNYVAANAAYEAAVGMAFGEMAGRNIFELFPNEGTEGIRLRRSLETVLRTGRSDTIAFIPYAIPRPEKDGGGFEQRFWTATHTPLFQPDGEVAYVLQNTVDVTELAESQLGASAIGVDLARVGGVAALQRAREAERAYRETLAESEEFRRLFAQAPGMIAIMDGSEHRFSFANEAYRAFVGHRPLKGRAVREVFPEIVEQGFLKKLDDVFRTGQPERGEGVRLVLEDTHGRTREAFIDFQYQPVRDGGGRICGVFVQGTDRTEQYRTLHRQRLLLDELNHRVKNTLSTVQSLARSSFRGLDDAGMRTFENRIKALSNVHDMISDRHWETIGIDRLVGEELAAFGDMRVRVDGPGVELTPRAAIALSMVFHELASNAVKYGRLVSADRSLEVEWRISEERILALDWLEAGNRSEPADWQSGFGMRTLRRVVEGELGGTLSLDLAESGFICRLRVALSEVGRVAD